MTARAVMVLGCTSGAGKSWLATALCRIYQRRGLRVAPYKAQNMSNHARVVVDAEGRAGEIGSAQYFQALAAGCSPEVTMNPVLLKPEAETRSQVVVMGQVRAELAALPWHERSALLAKTAESAYETLAARYDLVVLEGAGSPAEINLAASDYVNLGAARWSAARCLLVSDIDRGGSFAHLVGTHQLMPADVRQQIAGFVLNRFRGDPSLLAPAPEQVRQATGIATVAVIPYLFDHGLPEEDAVPLSRGAHGPQVAVIAGPAASNLDEFERLASAGVSVRYVRDGAALARADLVVLPGSKQTRTDLAWLRRSGMAAALQQHVAAGGRVLGLCGGLQMLGQWLHDPEGLEGAGAGSDAGLGLLPVSTRFERRKQLKKTTAECRTVGPWAALNGLPCHGYEIHTGSTDAPDSAVVQRSAHGHAIGWQSGAVFGTYLHGLLEDPDVVSALFSARLTPLEQTFDRLADLVENAFSPGALDALAGG